MRGAGDPIAVELRQPVDKSVQPVRACMCRSVPAQVVVRAAKPKIGAEIDNAIRQRREMIDFACGAAVWKAQKQQLDTIDRIRTHVLQRRPTSQIGMREMNELPVEAFAGDLPDIEERVTKQQA